MRILTVSALAAASVLAAAARLPAAEPAEVAGITEPLHDAKLSASVAGTIATNCFKEGDRIKAGQTILELDKRLEELEVARRKLVWEDKSELEAADARVVTTKTDLDATRQLMDRTKSVSQEELNKRELEYKMSVAERDKLRQAEERERIEFDMARQQLDKRSLVAPFDGVLTDLYLDPGEDCEPRQPLARLVDASACYLVCNMDAGLARRLKQGQTVTVKVPGPEAALNCTGEVAYVSPVVDAASGLQRVKIRFDNPGQRVSPGVTGLLQLPAATP